VPVGQSIPDRFELFVAREQLTFPPRCGGGISRVEVRVLVRAGRIRGRSRGLPAGDYFLETIGVFGDRPNGPGGFLRRRPHFVVHVERGFMVGVAEQLNSGRHLLNVGPVAIAARHAVNVQVDTIRCHFRSVDHAGVLLHRPLRRLAPEMLVAGVVGHLHTKEIVRASSRKFCGSRDLTPSLLCSGSGAVPPRAGIPARAPSAALRRNHQPGITAAGRYPAVGRVGLEGDA
jgi:hypothetical protein